MSDPRDLLSPSIWQPPNLKMAPQFKIRDPNEDAAQTFMEGLQSQVKSAELTLKQDQQIAMYCWHGYERLRVLSISMPSHNVVAMHCLDADDCPTDVTGHIHSTNFSIRVQTIVPPAVRTPIGFEMPS